MAPRREMDGPACTLRGNDGGAEDVNGVRQMMRLRATMLLVVAVALLGSAFMNCEPFCCVFEGETEVHAAMPCCTAPASISRPEVMREAVATANVRPSPELLVVPVEGEPVARVTSTRAVDTTRERERHRTSPPLFLANAQLLI